MKKQHDQEQMLDLYHQWQTSGESKTIFALNHGIRPTTFYYWTRKFEQVNTDSSSGFHQIQTAGSHPGELMAAIQYPSGTRLELYSSFQKLSNSSVQLLKTLTE